MPLPTVQDFNLDGLKEAELTTLRNRFGRNIVRSEKHGAIDMLKEVVFEPMFLLLLAACTLYFILGEINEGIMTIIAMCIVATISIYQGVRSNKALEALKDLTEPKVKIVRNGNETVIHSSDLLPGDVMIIGEGEKVPADAVILKCNDLTVNESVITGESLPVEKTVSHLLYQGAVIQTGMCYAGVTAIGQMTELGKIGKSIELYVAPKTHLQQVIGKFVKRLASFGMLAFIFIWAFNYAKSGDWLTSLLFGLTLTMAAIPEEIPVAFSSFMALGALRMSKLGIISRHPAVIENLGAVSVICLDKTGTITENSMRVSEMFSFRTGQSTGILDSELLYYAMLASEAKPFDEMEKAILEAYAPFKKAEIPDPVFEYPLREHPPMMTHVYGSEHAYTIASKGAPERIMNVCHLDTDIQSQLNEKVSQMASKGYRVIAVASCQHTGVLPLSQSDFQWKFEGLVSLYDPPRKNIRDVFSTFQESGIEIKLLTGDHAKTALNIAKQVGLPDGNPVLEGQTVMNMEMQLLQEAVKHTSIFARMFPEAKLKVIEALKENGEIVAMTGDGVNDGPALKAANIGIAMGHKGTQIARQAADIILTDDNLHKVTEAIRQGRRIFSNLKKAIRYIISIHIPIILTASLPLLLSWKYPNIFTPIHVIFLELIMGPTCSIFFENEPEPANNMKNPPREREAGLFNNTELWTSIIQGLAITASTLGVCYYFMYDHTLEAVRSFVFTSLLISNILLTFTNRSFVEPIFKTVRYKNNMVWPITLTSLSLIGAIHMIRPIRNLFGMEKISPNEFGICLIAGIAGVIWLEIIKILKKRSRKERSLRL